LEYGGGTDERFCPRFECSSRLYFGYLVHLTLDGLKGFSSARTSVKFLLATVAVLVPIAIFILQAPSHATNVITVNTLDDPGTSGECSLREAIENSIGATSGNGTCAAGTGTDTIEFSLSGTITLGSVLPPITNSSPGSLTIDGTGQTIIVDGATAPTSDRVMVVSSGATLTLNDLTIANGTFSGGGGGIFNSGTLTVTNSTFSGNSAPTGEGGGIFNDDTLTVTNSTFSGNSAGAGAGGAIFNAHL